MNSIGCNIKVSSRKEDISNASALILPGVGSYPKAMKNIKELELEECVRRGKPLHITTTTMYQNHFDLAGGDSNHGRSLRYGDNEAIYSNYIPRVDIHDQVQLGETALGKPIFLDTSFFE